MKKLSAIIKYLEDQDIPLATFERKAGLGYSYLSKTRDRGGEISQKALDKIQENAPEHFSKIFPESEQPIEDQQARYIVKEIVEPEEDCSELRIEVGYLKQRITDLERTIEDKVYIINLQKGMIQYEGQAKRSG